MIDGKTVGTQVQELQVLIHDLIAEEDNKAPERRSRGSSMIMGINIIEEVTPNNKKRKKSSGQRNEQNKKKFKRNCYNCGKAGHKASDYRAHKKGKKKSQVNMMTLMIYVLC
ncbi:hypothetical protein RND71_010582 [Anisodus tanguticus]|uniref:CCHC-type domain-containing protein n=1 Tax=Anisodus tanguticus TaxID=243964 RepID=A0AAE1VJ91_9SOLA|nr:hypothetical protein RND71_010582 [Anisodus tanguticus]